MKHANYCLFCDSEVCEHIMKKTMYMDKMNVKKGMMYGKPKKAKKVAKKKKK